MTAAPRWLQTLVESVAENMTAHGPMGPLGFRFRRLEELWDVLVYPLPVELVGGAHDGGVAAPGFSLDLGGLRAVFARVDALGWDAHGSGSEDGPCVSVEGEFTGHEVWLRVLASAPADEGPALKVDTTQPLPAE